MGMAVTFDTLKYMERLEHVGVPSEQARVQVEALAEVLSDEVCRIADQYATKKDFAQEVSGLRQEVGGSRLELKAEINALRLDTKASIAEAKADLIRWVVGVGILQMALIAGLVLKLVN